MLQYLPGFGSVSAGGADDGSPVNDFAEEPLSPQMRLEALSPRSTARCSQRAQGALSMSPARSARSGSGPLVFDSPASASPTRLLQAERQYWAELTGRQVHDLHEALEMKTNGLVAALEKLKREMTEKLQKDLNSATTEFATLLSSQEQRLRNEQQAAIEAARKDLSLCAPKDGDAWWRKDWEADGTEPGIASKLRHLDGMVEEIGLRVDGLHVKLEEELTTALAEERKTRGKAISDVCQYIEHVVALQESDAKAEKRRTDNVIGGLEDRVQVLEGAIGHCLRESMLDSEMEPQGTQRGLFVSQDVSQNDSHEQEHVEHSEHEALEQTGASEGGFTLFSEEMRESLKHIVRKVGDTMSKDSDVRAAPSLAGVIPPRAAPPGSSSDGRPLWAPGARQW